jgi:hypothetical protein
LSGRPSLRRLANWGVRPLALMLALACLAGVATACGGSSSSAIASAAPRPHTDATLSIVQPTPNQVTGPTVTVQLALTGAQIVPANSSHSRPDQGHIHLYVDQRLVSMYYQLTETETGLKPGLHSLQAEFVASDHLPFANRVIASVLFQVKS